MPRYKAKITIKLKQDYVDPEGNTVANSLRELGFDVRDVRVGKVYFIEFDAENEKHAKIVAEEMCKKLLANPVKDDYEIEFFGK